jgi:hypothetical protein
VFDTSIHSQAGAGGERDLISFFSFLFSPSFFLFLFMQEAEAQEKNESLISAANARHVYVHEALSY